MDAYFSKDGRMQKDIKAGVREAENEVLSVASSSEDIAIEINDGCQGTLVFNYALQQNGEKLIKNLQIANNTTFDFNGAVIRISFDPDYAYVVEGAVDLPAGEVCEFVPAISFKTSYLLKLTEKQLGMLNIEIIYQGEIVAQKRWPVELLACDEWAGSKFSSETLAAFVLPNHPAVSAVLTKAAKVLSDWGEASSFEGYQSGDPQRVMNMMAAIYEALRQSGIVYNNPPASFDMAQRVRLPHKVLEEHKGTCLDLSVLYASCLEAAGLHPLLILVHGHAFAGCWLGETAEDRFAGGYTNSYQLMLEKTAKGNPRIFLVNCVNFCVDGMNFEGAMKEAKSYLDEPEKFNYALDIDSLRKRNENPVRPIALAVSAEEQPAPDVNEFVLQKAEKPEIRLQAVKQLEPEDSKAYAKQRYWEKKLLDVSLTNPLISIYKRRYVNMQDEQGNAFRIPKLYSNNLPIAWHDIGRLEDRLADGLAFHLRYDFADILENPLAEKEINVSFEKKLAEFGIKKEMLKDNKEAVNRALNYAVGSFIDTSFTREQLFLKAGDVAELAKRLKNTVKTAKRSIEENGANTLYLVLGELRWFAEEMKIPKQGFENDEDLCACIDNYISNEALYAPLILVPVDLIRNSADDSYILRSRQEETQINVTLLEFLKQNFGIEIEGLDPLPLDAHGVDIELILNKIKLAVKDKFQWDVDMDTSLGHFSFAKFVMWSDIHNHAAELAQNKVIDSLLHGGRKWTPKNEEITEANIEQVAEKYNMLVPSSADSSQLVAIAKALSGESFVLQGPPGTGKSQTITNLIANALYNDKKVLFVAEKKAALDVVKKRLDELGLAHFCLSLHSEDANKLSVLARLEKTLEITDGAVSSREYALAIAEIRKLRTNLNAIINAMHGQREYGISLYQAITILKQNVAEKGKIRLERVPKLPAHAQVLQWQNLVREYKGAMLEMGGIYDSALDGYNGTAYSMLLRQEFSKQIDDLHAEIPKAKSALQSFFAAIGMEINEIDFHDLLKRLHSWQALVLPQNLLPAMATSETPEQAVSKLQEFLRHLEAYKKDLAACEQYFDLQVLQMDIRGAKTAWEFAVKMGDLEGKCNRLLADLQHFAKPGVVIKREVMQYNYNYLSGLVDKGNAVLLLGERVKAYLGSMYNGVNTDSAAVESAITATMAFIQQYNERKNELKLPLNIFIHAAESCELQMQVQKLVGFADSLEHFVREYDVSDAVWNKPFFALDSLEKMLERFAANVGRLRSRSAYNAVAVKLKAAGLDGVVEAFEHGKITDRDIEAAFAYSLYYNLVMQTLAEDERLADFYGVKYNEMIKRYREVIETYQKACIDEIELKLRHKVASVVNDNSYAEQIGVLKKAIKGKGRNKPIRKLFSEIKTLLPEIAPCMLMNPISVAQYLAIDFPKFDLVIFDEASQIPTSEAVGAIARGIDAIVVGDPKQMPPTTFFAAGITDVDEDVEDMESLLIDCQTISMPVTELKWHYRSQHESLIAFSNAKYYDSSLYTFPTPDDLVSEVKIVHPDGFYDRKSGCNKAEAQAIVAEILRRYRDPELRKRSIGVITFNIKQQTYIEDMLEKTLHLPENEDLAAYNISQEVFIKNLENVQGDEADVILFSIGYAQDKDGKLTMNFGPLNRDGGWRRLNVAVSRSRQEMIIFSVLRPEQIRNDVTAQGVRNLKEFLDYAENRKTLRMNKKAITQAENAEYVVAEIAEAIKAMGYDVSCDIGNSEFTMDIGVINPYNSEVYLLGILLDSENCKEAATARDRFVLQPSILQRLGWKLLRLWVLDWLDDPELVKRKIQALLSDERENARKVFEASQQSIKEQQPDDVQEQAAVAELEPEEDEDSDIVSTQSEIGTAVMSQAVPVPSATKPAETSAAQQPDQPVLAVVENTEVDSAEHASGENASAEPAEAETANANITEDAGTAENTKTEGSTDASQTDGQTLKRKLSRRGPKEYKLANIKLQGGQNDFYQAANREMVKNVILKLLAKEAPIEFTALRERVMKLWSFNKASQKFNNLFTEIITEMNVSVVHDRDKDFVWNVQQEPELYNIYREIGERNLQQVCTEELINGLYVAIRENGSMQREELAREGARRFGCSKFTKVVEETFAYALDKALNEDILRVLNNGKIAISRR